MNNKIAVSLSYLLIFTLNVFSQSVQWAKEGGSAGYEYGNAITTDDSGNVFVAGQIEFDSYFDSLLLSTNGIHDIFIGKFGPDGSIKWLQSEGGVGGDVGYGIGVDAMKNSYITGEVEHDAEFGVGTILHSAGGNDVFIAKYDYYGNVSWANRYGGSDSDKGLGMAVSSAGNIYITGYFSSSSISFGSTSLSNSGQHEVFVVKLNSSGNVTWARKGGGSNDDIGYGIAYDKNGNVYVAGSFTGSASFNGHTVNTSGTVGGFLIKYNSSGTYQWIKEAGACCDITENLAVTTDENGNVYVAGYFFDKTKFGSNTFTSVGGSDIVIAKYDPSGNVLWAARAGGPYDDMANAISVDTVTHQIYVSGQIDDHGYFGSNYVGAAGNRDAFVAAYDMNGNNLWAKCYGGVMRDASLAITVEPRGSIYTSGFFTQNGIFGPDTLTGHAIGDLMVFKVTPTLPTQPTNQDATINSSAVNCNDINLTFTPGNGSSRIIIARAGSPVNAFPVDGNYYYASSVFGNGSNLGNGNFVVYDGTGNNVTVTGLTYDTTYYFAAIEYNGTGASNNYLTGGPATSNLTAGTVNVQITPVSSSVCLGGSTTLVASGNATNYNWSPSATLSSATGSSVMASPLVSTTYSVTGSNSQGCQGSSQITITVNQNPTASFSALNAVCENASAFSLTGGSPAGGTYSGLGVIGTQFNPSVSGSGTIPLSYIYVDPNGCSDTAQSSVLVKVSPVINLGNDTILCASNSILLSAGSGFTSYAWSNGATGNSIVVDSNGTGIGTTIISATVTNAGGCSDKDSILITFDVCNSIYENHLTISNLDFYPNPFSEKLNIFYDIPYSITIYDLCGRIVEQQLNVSGKVSAGMDLCPGIYSIRITSERGMQLKTVLKSQ